MTEDITHKKYNYILLFFYSLIMFFLLSCSEKAADEPATESHSESRPEYAMETAAPVGSISTPSEKSAASAGGTSPEHMEEAVVSVGAPSESSKLNKLDEYNVVLGVDEKMEIPGFPGELRVWIGSSDFKPNFPTDMTQDRRTVPADALSARVEPFAPAFEIDPPETQCIKIHPSGSEVRFELIPKKSGMFEVSANVYLYDSLDCSGSPIPKTAAVLTVTVEVNKRSILVEKARELWNIFWEKSLEFWAALIALIFGLILFLIRNKLKQWFGFDNK